MILFEKIKYKIKDVSVRFLIKISLFLNWPYLTAMALWLASSRINSKCGSNYTVLCMGRSIFVDDVNAMAAYSGRIKYVVIWRTYFQIIMRHFIKDRGENKLTENNYHSNNYFYEGKEKYYSYLKKVFPILRKFLGFDAALSGNFTYLEQQEFVRICEENKVPFAILHKEGMGAYGDYVDVRGYHGCQLNGHKILFYNEAIAKAIVELNLPGLTGEKIAIVGIPRFDLYFGKKNKTEEKQMVLFSFSPMDRFFLLIEEKQKIESAKRRGELFHKLVMEYALANPDVKVIIKTKFAKHYLNYVKDIFNKYFTKEIFNLIITNEGEPFKLIRDSFAVFGFNSTALIEAVVADKIIISPKMKDLAVDQSWDFFKDYPSIINYAESIDDIGKAIKNSNNGNIGDEIKNKFLERLVYKPDGKSGARVETEIIKLIENYE